LDLLETADRGPVEPEAVLEARFGEFGDRNREMLGRPRQVGEAKIDD